MLQPARRPVRSPVSAVADIGRRPPLFQPWRAALLWALVGAALGLHKGHAWAAAQEPSSPPALRIAKWFNNHSAAISITYDALPRDDSPVDGFASELGLVLDYEVVTQRHIDQVPDWVEHDLTELVGQAVPGKLMKRPDERRMEYARRLIAQGFGYFGHGHWHVVHDALSYAQALDSFRLCFAVMQQLRLKPVAYAYPGGAGRKEETQRALADAGFLAGRLAALQAGQSPYIVPHSAKAPENWFHLPALAMDGDVRRCRDCINNTEELLPILDTALERKAWIIPVYHNIGRSSATAASYPWQGFKADMRAIAERDFWVAPMNDVVLYLRQREKAEATLRAVAENGLTSRIEVVLADGLDNDRFDQPLTLIFAPPPDWAGLPVRVTQNGQLVDWIFADGQTALISLRPNEAPYILRPWRPPPDSAAPSPSYRSLHQSIVSGQSGRPAARSTFDVYVDGARLAYFKSPCTAADVEARFFLHLFPADAARLSERRRQYGFESLGFDFPGNGVILDGSCLVVAKLPDYETARIRTGQFVRGTGQLWKAEIE